jgi:hypothetical protein
MYLNWLTSAYLLGARWSERVLRKFFTYYYVVSLHLPRHYLRQIGK